MKASGATQISDLNRSARLTGPFVFFLAFGIYLATAAPCLTFWDSGELILGAYSLGLPHPPAYPVLCLSGKLFSFIPFGNVAYRLNILSAFFGAATAYVLFRLLSKAGEGVAGFDYAAAAVALFFAFYKSFWSVAVITEVYTLNSFLLAAAFYSAFMHETSREKRYLYLSAFLLGLALANHQSALLSVPVFFAYYISSGKNYKNAVAISVMISLFLLAYSVNIYLPLRASTGPVLNVGAPAGIKDFAWVIKWPEYFESLKPLAGKALGFITGKKAEVLAGLVLVVAFTYAFRRSRLLLLAAFAAVTNLAGIELLTAGAEGIKKWGLHSKFYIPSVLFAAIFAACLLAQLLRYMPQGRKTLALVMSISSVVFFAASFEFWNNYKANDNSRNFFAYDFGSNTLKSAKRDAALFGWGDNAVFPVWYLQGVEKYRDDVLFIHGELLTYQWYMSDIQKRIYKKYGIAYVPRNRLPMLTENVMGMKLRLEEDTPVYFDYSSSDYLGISKKQLIPQGLVHLVPSWSGSAVSYSGIWNRYVLRGALDNSTDRSFAAEGILDIYGWESAYWGLLLQQEGDSKTALTALKLSKKLRLNEPRLDLWIQALEGMQKGE